MAPHGVYRCAGDDRWLAMACEDDAQWRAICEVMDRRELSRDPRFADAVSRMRHRAELDGLVGAWAAGRDAHKAASQLQSLGVPASSVKKMADLLDDPQLAHRAWIQHSRHAEAGAVPHTLAGFRLSETPISIERAAPRFGEHNDEVLRNTAGLDEARIASLRDRGIMRDEPPASH
jgi:crotonobetainyl-CoA:carnitine CoA-transferase CaiB-like acyl-CoA transferase